jgi:hypothetical protein
MKPGTHEHRAEKQGLVLCSWVPGSALKGAPVRNDNRNFPAARQSNRRLSLSRDVVLQAELKAARGPSMLLARRDPENDSAPSEQVRGPTGDLALDALVESVV